MCQLYLINNNNNKETSEEKEESTMDTGQAKLLIALDTIVQGECHVNMKVVTHKPSRESYPSSYPHGPQKEPTLLVGFQTSSLRY